MNKSFYQFVCTFADPYQKDDRTLFANQVQNDVGFPKQNRNYYELADYIEWSGDYSRYTRVFDELFDLYRELIK